MSPIILPSIIPYITPFKEFRLQLIWPAIMSPEPLSPNQRRPMINKPPPFEGLNIRIRVMIPMKGKGLASTLPATFLGHLGTRRVFAQFESRCTIRQSLAGYSFFVAVKDYRFRVEGLGWCYGIRLKLH